MQVDWNVFTPLSALAGGALIGLAVAVFLLGLGGIAGISGLLGSALQGLWRGGGGPVARERWLFLAGLVAAPLLWRLVGDAPASRTTLGPLGLVGAGLLVGFGTRLSGGCTSGHGVCGVARLSRRSVVATGVFMATGIVTVYVLRHVG